MDADADADAQPQWVIRPGEAGTSSNALTKWSAIWRGQSLLCVFQEWHPGSPLISCKEL